MFTYKNPNDLVPTPYHLWHGRRLNLPVILLKEGRVDITVAIST